MPANLADTLLGDLVLSEADFQHFRRFIHDKAGIELNESKRAFVQSRLNKRVRNLGLASFSDYWRLVSQSEKLGPPQEAQRVINLLSTNETYFFREADHFDWLGQHARQHAETHSRSLKVWSAASSTGEEAYTIGMVLAETLGADAEFEILASDINTKVLKRARRGIYAAEQAGKVPPGLLHRYFLQGHDEYEGMLRIVPEIARHIRFEQINLLACPRHAIGPFDIIFLRNVLIYFNADTKAQILQHLVDKLRPGGYLLTGHSESLHQFQLPLTLVRPTYYRRHAPGESP